MLRSAPTIRRQALVFAVAIAVGAFAAPQAFSGGGSQYRDGWYGYAVSLTKASHRATLDGRSPDTRDAAVAAHRQRSSMPVLDGRSPDTRDAARIAHASLYGPPDGWYGYAVSLTDASRSAPVLDGRSPDTRDAAVLAHSPVVTITLSPGFEWGDFGIGFAAAIGAMSILAVSTRLLAARNGRKQPSPVATA